MREGDVEDITDELTPRALTKCDTNSLLMAMEVGNIHEYNITLSSSKRMLKGNCDSTLSFLACSTCYWSSVFDHRSEHSLMKQEQEPSA